MKNLIEIMTGDEHGKDPGYATNKIIVGEFLTVHTHDACHDGSKSADDGKKSGEDYGLPTVFFIECLGIVKVPFFE